MISSRRRHQRSRCAPALTDPKASLLFAKLCCQIRFLYYILELCLLSLSIISVRWDTVREAGRTTGSACLQQHHTQHCTRTLSLCYKDRFEEAGSTSGTAQECSTIKPQSSRQRRTNSKAPRPLNTTPKQTAVAVCVGCICCKGKGGEAGSAAQSANITKKNDRHSSSR